MKKSVAIRTLLAAGLVAASAAHAEDLIVNQPLNGWYAVAQAGAVTHTPSVFDVKIVENQTVTGSFLAYCIQAAEGALSTAVSYTASPYAASSAVQELYDRFYGVSVASQSNAVAFQLALWDLSGEVALGAYTFVSDAAARATAGDWVAAVQADNNPVAPLWRLTQWTNGAQQDVLQASPVPEASTSALLFAGLGAIGLLVRRRTRYDA